MFKEIEWQTTRIEATAVGTDEDFLTPLRLIANQAKIRICVKKRLSGKAFVLKFYLSFCYSFCFL